MSIRARSKRIIAVDPGYERVGFAVIEKEERGKEILLYSDCFETSAKLPFEERLLSIGAETERLIKKWGPEAFAIETLFFNTNQKTASRVSEARGALIYLAARHGLSVSEYTPLQVKIAITGYGRSEKRQVTDMVKKLITIEKSIKRDDEYDAIAIGLTHLASEKINSYR